MDENQQEEQIEVMASVILAGTMARGLPEDPEAEVRRSVDLATAIIKEVERRRSKP